MADGRYIFCNPIKYLYQGDRMEDVKSEEILDACGDIGGISKGFAIDDTLASRLPFLESDDSYCIYTANTALIIRQDVV